MADNFNLRTFLTENKLTKNAKLLNENVDIAQAFSQAGITGEVTVAFHSSHGMSDEPEFQVMNAQDALAMITSQALLDDEEDVLIAQGDEIDQQGDLDPETQGLECKLEVAILDYGTYEVYQGSNKESLDEGSYSDSYDTPASKLVHGQLSSIVDIFSKSRSEEQQELDAAIEAAEQKTGTQVTPTERSVLSQQLNWIRTQDMEMEREGVEEGAPSAGMTAKEKSALAKKAHAGKDIGKKGAGFEKVEKAAEKKYGSKEAGQKVAAAAMWKNAAKHEQVNENTMTKREQYLTRLVENALGLTNNDEDQEFDPGHDIEQAQHNIERQYEGNEMADETVIPEYSNIDELMKSIDHGTNKVAEEHKIQEMKKIAEALRMKAKKMEESEHAAHISPKDLKQLATDAAKLEKAAEKLKAAFDKKFNKKEKPAAAAKTEKVEALQEGTFDLRKFLAENRK